MNEKEIPFLGSLMHVASMMNNPVVSDEEVEAFERKQRLLEIERNQSRLLEHYFKSSGDPSRYHGESLDTYIPQDEEARANLRIVKDFCSKPDGKSLIICGRNGTGKTHIGCGIVRELGGYYRTMLKLMYELDGAMSFKAVETKIQILDRMSRSPVLVLDEVGRGLRDDSMREVVCYLVNEVYSNNKSIVLITNMGKRDTVEWLGLAVKDRLNETCQFVEFNGDSYRGKKRAELFGKKIG